MEIDNYIKNLIIFLAVLVIITPLIKFNILFFSSVSEKNFYFRFLIEIMFLLWIFLFLKNPVFSLKKSPLLYSLLFLIFTASLSTILSVNPYFSLWSSLERMTGLVTYLHLFVFFLIISTVFNHNYWIKYFNFSIITSVIVGFYGLYTENFNFLSWNNRLISTLGNPIYLALYFVLIIFITLFLLVNSSNILLKVFYSLLILLNSFFLLLTKTRGAIIGFLVGIIFFLITFLMNFFNKKKQKIIVLIIFILFITIVFFLTPSIINKPLFERFKYSKMDYAAKLTILKIAYAGFKERPFFGWGLENFLQVYIKNYIPIQRTITERWFDRVHNEFFEWLIAGGIFGFFAYLSIFITALYIIWKNNNFSSSVKKTLIALLIAYAISVFFEFHNISASILFFSILAFVHSSNNNQLIKIKKNKKYIIALFLFLLTLFFFIQNIKSLFAAYYLEKAFSKDEVINNRLKYIQKSISYNSFGSFEARLMFFDAVASLGDVKMPADLRKKILNLAKKEIEIQMKLTPDNFKFLYYAGRMLRKNREYDFALVLLERAYKKFQRMVPAMLELGIAYTYTKQYNKAYNVFREGVIFSPEDPLINKAYNEFIDMIYKNEKAIVTLDKVKVEIPLKEKKYINNDLAVTFKKLVNNSGVFIIEKNKEIINKTRFDKQKSKSFEKFLKSFKQALQDCEKLSRSIQLCTLNNSLYLFQSNITQQNKSLKSFLGSANLQKTYFFYNASNVQNFIFKTKNVSVKKIPYDINLLNSLIIQESKEITLKEQEESFINLLGEKHKIGFDESKNKLREQIKNFTYTALN